MGAIQALGGSTDLESTLSRRGSAKGDVPSDLAPDETAGRSSSTAGTGRARSTAWAGGAALRGFARPGGRRGRRRAVPGVHRRAVPTAEQLRLSLARGVDDFQADRARDHPAFEARTDELVGGAGLHRTDDPACFEIGCWVWTDRTRPGYATSAAGALVEAPFATTVTSPGSRSWTWPTGPAPRFLRSSALPCWPKKTARLSPRGHTSRGHVRVLDRPR